MNTQLIFFDIDGTLSRDGHIDANNLETLYTLHDKRIKVVVATGRGIAMMPDDIVALFDAGIVDALIGMNGQYSRTQDGVISDYPLTMAQANAIATVCKQFKLTYKLDSLEHIAWSQMTHYYDLLIEKYPNFIIDPDYYKHTAVYQCSILLTEDEETDVLDEAFAEHGLHVTRWQTKGADILPKNASKARGIDDVCTHFGIDLAHTMAFGDGLNDIDMLQHVGIGIAMGDGWDALQSVADHVTGSIEERGIQTALAHFGVL